MHGAAARAVAGGGEAGLPSLPALRQCILHLPPAQRPHPGQSWFLAFFVAVFVLLVVESVVAWVVAAFLAFSAVSASSQPPLQFSPALTTPWSVMVHCSFVCALWVGSLHF